MKKNYSLLWGFCLQFISFSLFAQLRNPSQWDTFVLNSELNRPLTDTILLQSFEGTLWDNWNFQEKSNPLTKVVNASDFLVQNQRGSKSLQLPPGSHIEFKLTEDIVYDNYFVTFFVAATGLKKDAVLQIVSNLEKGGNFSYNLSANADNFRLNFGENFKEVNPKDRISIGSNPIDLEIKVEASEPEGSFFIDNLLTYSNTRHYSLFKGEGMWENKTGWSHLPPYRSRSALVKGDLKIGSEIICKELHLVNGTISLQSGSELCVKELFLHENEIAFFPQGKMTISGQLHLYRTFPEKGKWYFVSFPADIYKTDIDSRFQLKDESPNQGGDFYYVSTYDGIQRSSTNSFGNWKVIPESFPDDVPLFEKGKGYLIALDEKAADNRLLFSSQTGRGIDWSSDLYSLVLDIPLKNNQMKQEHYGWVLCGNPFASPLPVKNIQKNNLLDGFLYYYDGIDYKEIPLESDQLLPPYSAFFLKSRLSTTVKIAPPLSPSVGELLPTRALQKNPAEPSSYSSDSFSGIASTELNGKVRENTLYITNAVGAGTLMICDLSGRVVLQKPLPVGDSVIPLMLTKGIYIYSIRAGKQQAQEKFVLY